MRELGRIVCDPDHRLLKLETKFEVYERFSDKGGCRLPEE